MNGYDFNIDWLGLGGGASPSVPYMGPYNQQAYAQANQAMQNPSMMQQFQPPAQQQGGMFQQFGDWMGDNSEGLQGMGSILGGVSNVGQMWNAFKAMDMAKKQFRFQKDAWNKNYENSLQSYNTQLADRASARQAFNPDFNASGYLKDNKLG